jgi:hypothetical protein
VNILRILLVVLAIVILLATLSSIDPHTSQFVVSPVLCFFFVLAISFRSALYRDELTELTAAPRSLATRAPPVF